MPSEKNWNIKPTSSLAPKIAVECNLSLLQSQLLINRGLSDKESVQAFLHLRLADMADPMLMKGMRHALPVILKAIESGEKIAIFGDYDADGLTATALLFNFFAMLDLPVSFYVPNRLDEGYGLNRHAIEKIRGNGVGLIITVDCGISNAPEIVFARSLGMEVVVTDHHQVQDQLQLDCPAINPHQPGCSFPFKDLAGVGVAFFLAVAIRAELRDRGWFKTRPEPDLKEYLDLVALGTVADRVRLIGQNRILVNSGIEAMAGTRWAGMKALMEVSDIQNGEISAEDLAFRLGPRLNAPGRIGESDLGIQLLTSQDGIFAKNFALRINSANSKRQIIERDIFTRIEDRVDTAGGVEECRTLLMGDETWHRGVLGIVASRLVDKYYRPALIYNVHNGLAVGSGRSIDGFNLFLALNALSPLLEKFGGHSHAAGFTIRVENIGVFKRELEAMAREKLRDEALIPSIDVDMELPLEQINTEMIHEIRMLSPFGAGNPEPSFVAHSVDVLESRVVGERHLKLKVRQAGNAKPFDAIGFGLGGMSLPAGRTADLIFTPELNRWQGYENIQLRVMDIKSPAEKGG